MVDAVKVRTPKGRSRAGGSTTLGARAAERLMRWPRRNHFADLQPQANELHPIDVLIDGSPEIRRASRRARRLLARVQRQANANDVLNFEAERNAAEWARVEAAYNLGFEGGLVVGRAERLRLAHGRHVRSRGVQALFLQLRAALAETRASPKEIEVLLLEVAYAHAVEPPSEAPARRRRP